MRRLLPLLGVVLLVGCSTTRVFTIHTKPPDAAILVDGVDRGKGELTTPIVFAGKEDTHTVTAMRKGYKDTTVKLQKDYPQDAINIEMGYLSRRVTINVTPAAANLSVDGKLITTEASESASVDLEFTVDARDRWTTHTITAEREGFEAAEQVVSWTDQSPQYTLHLEPRRKDLVINTTPAGAQLTLDNEPIGTSPATVAARAFPVDLDANEVIPQKIRAEKPGYDPVEVKIGWDGGKTEYSINLVPKTKTVRIVTEPPGGVVTIDGKELARNGNSATAELVFPPTNEKGELKTYTATVTKKTAESEWYPQDVVIGWDEGKTDYTVTLREILTRAVNLLTPTLERADDGWEVQPKLVSNTIAWKDVSERQKDPPVQLTRLPRGTQIDTIAISPDGAHLLFTIVYGMDKQSFRSQIIVVRTDGSQGADYLSDGKSLEITPSYTPGGDRVIFSSNRAGKRLKVWSMSALGAPGITQLTTGDTNDLWPNVDSDPKPRLFYQANVDTRPDPRLYMTQLGSTTLTDLTQMGGGQPRISPKNDTIVFCAVNDKTGKRDLYTMPDRGGTATNLTNTPDVDEFDPAWSKDGARLAFVSDAGVDEERRHNLDVWVMEIARPERPVQITTNGSWDDHPAWDPSGGAIYFRSNRGGEWAVWRIATK